MITCDIKYLEFRCAQRGYTLDEVKACIVHRNGDQVTVDETHRAYPRAPKSVIISLGSKLPAPAPPTFGPGTELKKLLNKFGFTATPNCACNKRARLMDENEQREPGWCAANIDTIVGWLREEAEKRKLPFVNVAGKLLVRRAIAAAKKAKRTNTDVAPPLNPDAQARAG